MKPSDPSYRSEQGSGAGLIVSGLLIAVLGAVMVMFLVVGVSYLYVARYAAAVLNLIGFILTGFVFLRSYGPYLNRLEMHAPMEPQLPEVEEVSASAPAVTGQTTMDGSTPPEPVPTHVAIAVATGAYGALIVLAGLIFTNGEDRVLNALAGTALMLCALITWRWARPSR